MTGTVINAATGTPIPSAMVMITATGDSTDRQITNTDARGEFLVAGLRPAEYSLRIRKIGFAAIEPPARTLKEGETWNGRYEMEPVATTLDTVRAQAERTNLTPGSQWFMKHYREGKGYFTSGDALALARTDACASLGKVPGLAIHGAGPIGETRYDGERGIKCKDGRYIMPLFTPRCIRTVVDRLMVVAYVDSGAFMVRTLADEKTATSIRSIAGALNAADTLPRELLLQEIAGIEIFRNRDEVPRDFSIPAIPLSYNEEMRRCAYMIVWTRRAW